MSRGKLQQRAKDYLGIEKSSLMLDGMAYGQHDLKQLAANFKIPESDFQRLFSRWAGGNLKRFKRKLFSKVSIHV